ncbi:MAG: hypothetical protein AAF909_10145 [Pseudomonadota bacterium]
MFDAIIEDQALKPIEGDRAQAGPAVWKLIVSDQADAAETLTTALGGDAAMLVVSETALAADWPQYVVARARTGGAFVVERDGLREPVGALRLAKGALSGRAATALVVSGQLILVLEDCEASGALQAAAA